jgi:hypothetical protein
MSMRQLLSQAGDRRRSPRTQPEDLVAYYWTGALPRPNSVFDICPYGAHIFASDRFYLGTVIEIVLEHRAAGRLSGAGSPHICVHGRVLRTLADGFCVEFVFGDASERRRFRHFLGQAEAEKRE